VMELTAGPPCRGVWALAPAVRPVNTRRGAPPGPGTPGPGSAPRAIQARKSERLVRRPAAGLLDLERLDDPLPVLLGHLHPRLAGVVLVGNADLRLLDGHALRVVGLAPGGRLRAAYQM